MVTCNIRLINTKKTSLTKLIAYTFGTFGLNATTQGGTKIFWIPIQVGLITANAQGGFRGKQLGLTGRALKVTHCGSFLSSCIHSSCFPVMMINVKLIVFSQNDQTWAAIARNTISVRIRWGKSVTLHGQTWLHRQVTGLVQSKGTAIGFGAHQKEWLTTNPCQSSKRRFSRFRSLWDDGAAALQKS